MNREFQQYRFARIEAQNVARARLESQFMSGTIDFEKLERAIERELAEPTLSAPWRRSEIEQMGCRDGARMAALEFSGHIVRNCNVKASLPPLNLPHFRGDIDSQC
jgi:hypothetical protein